jgi:hypothetical protein
MRRGETELTMNLLLELGNRLFVYDRYLATLNEGTEWP